MEHVTMTEIIQFNQEVVYVDVHILPLSSTKPYEWFSDHKNQELLALIYDVILSKVSLDASNVSHLNSKYQIKAGRTLRILYIVKPSNLRQHLVIPPQFEPSPTVVPRAAFISDEGKKVLPFLNCHTQGSGYTSYHVSDSRLEVYVDAYPSMDSRGVFKVLASLDPSCQVGPDISAYLQHMSSSSEPSFDNIATISAANTLRVGAGLTRKRKKKIYKVLPKRRCQVARLPPDQLSLRELVNKGDASKSDKNACEFVDNLSKTAMEEFCDTSSHDSFDGVSSREVIVAGDETPPLLPKSEHHMSVRSTDQTSRMVVEDELSHNPAIKPCSVNVNRLNQGIRGSADEEALLITTDIDLTVCSDVIVLSSGDEELGSDQVLTASVKKRRKMKPLKEILEGVEYVGELSEKQLNSWLYISKPVMVDIFKGTVHSRRHEEFTSGCKRRGALVYQMDAHVFSKAQIDLITKFLLHVFCAKHMKYFGYVMSVLLPECLIRIISDVHSVPFTKAEEMMMDHHTKS